MTFEGWKRVQRFAICLPHSCHWLPGIDGQLWDDHFFKVGTRSGLEAVFDQECGDRQKSIQNLVPKNSFVLRKAEAKNSPVFRSAASPGCRVTGHVCIFGQAQ
jgi:hypothetical protein